MPIAGLPIGANTAELYRMLTQACPLVNGRAVACVSDGTAGFQAFRHNLGRPYIGGFVTASNTNATQAIVFPASTASFPTGTDGKTHVLVRATAAAAMTFTLWVY